jgi:hypothetical protein
MLLHCIHNACHFLLVKHLLVNQLQPTNRTLLSHFSNEMVSDPTNFSNFCSCCSNLEIRYLNVRIKLDECNLGVIALQHHPVTKRNARYTG